MSNYFVGIMFCLVMALAYPAFRADAFAELRHCRIRKRDIRQKQKGALNFWFYTELEKAYGLGKYGVLLRVYPIVAGIVTVFHIFLGWIKALAVVDIALVSLTALYLSVIIFYACIRRNRRLFDAAFLLWGMKETKSFVPKGKLVPTDKNGFLIEYYSTIFDLILAALPLIFPLMMALFERLGF
ncbi:MAG: hypothetical protein IJW00_06300 [Clostridia bacterium]|nr:hypothetical protein [Clostridia bacterium]